MNKRYRFNGKERDEETGLYYYGARYYAAWLARWTAADPLGIGADGPGVYNYTRGSPLVYTDPNGKQPTPVTVPAPSPPVVTPGPSGPFKPWPWIFIPPAAGAGGAAGGAAVGGGVAGTVGGGAAVEAGAVGISGGAIAGIAAAIVVGGFVGYMWGSTKREAADRQMKEDYQNTYGSEIPALAPISKPVVEEAPSPALPPNAKAPPKTESAPVQEPTSSDSARAPGIESAAVLAPGLGAVYLMIVADNQQVPYVYKTPNVYSATDTQDRRFRVSIGLEDGKLSGTIRTKEDILDSSGNKIGERRSSQLRGQDQFKAALEHFKGRFDTFEAQWDFGDNLARFNANIQRGDDPDKAAADTWTGDMLEGFSVEKVEGEQNPDGTYRSAKVTFKRQQP